MQRQKDIAATPCAKVEITAIQQHNRYGQYMKLMIKYSSDYFEKNKFLLIIIIISLLGFISCGKKVEDKSPEFIGHWFANPYGGSTHIDIDISENSYATYNLVMGLGNKTYKGPAHVNNKHLRIGSFRYFKIIEYPHTIDTTIEKHTIFNYNDNTSKLANWKMVLDGIKPNDNYWCGEATYYKADD